MCACPSTTAASSAPSTSPWPSPAPAAARSPDRFAGQRDEHLTSAGMALLLAAKVWTYWISFFLLVPAVLLVAFVAVGYLFKVQAKKYPRR